MKQIKYQKTVMYTTIKQKQIEQQKIEKKPSRHKVNNNMDE